jgi:hypothetical protein
MFLDVFRALAALMALAGLVNLLCHAWRPWCAAVPVWAAWALLIIGVAYSVVARIVAF